MADKNFLIKNGLTVGSTERISSAGVITGTTSTQSVGNSSTALATTAYVRGEIDALIDSAPGTLNTLDELAAAINDDAAFNTTLTNAVALKSPLASPTFTGNVGFPDDTIDLAHMSANSVDSDQYVDGSIDLVHMSANSVDSDQYVDGSIDAAHLAAAQTNITSVGTLTGLTGGTGDLIWDTDTLVVDSSTDRVGIGDTTPSVKLDVYQSDSSIGSVDFRHVNGNRILINPSYNYYDAYNHIFRGLSGSSTWLTIDVNGMVGIGTTTPASYSPYADNLVVAGSAETGITIASANSSQSGVYFADGTTGNQQYRGYVDYNHGVDDLIFGAAGAEKFRFTADGEIGIGGTNYGTDGQILTSGGAGAAAAWEDAAGGGPTFKAFGTGSIMIGDDSTGTINAANYNTGLGIDVFAALTTGDNNIAIGHGALDGGNPSYNIAIGVNAIGAAATGSSNVAIGTGAMASNTSGSSDVAIGHDSMTANTEGDSNVAIGAGSLGTNTTGASNTAVGKDALYANIDGTRNTAIGRTALQTNLGNDNTSGGYFSMYLNSSGGNNTAFGVQALRSNTTASYNTAIGANALYANQTGAQNTAVGNGALNVTTASDNTAVGNNALAANQGGTNNVAVGNAALSTNVSGAYNTAIGRGALGNYTGSHTTAVGRNALSTLVSASGCTAVGNEALTATTGNNNTALGKNAGAANVAGSENVFVGSFAGDAAGASSGAHSLTLVGYNAGTSLTSAVSATLIGRDAGAGLTTAGSNTFIGQAAGQDATSGTTSCCVFIGGSAGRGPIVGYHNIAIGMHAFGNTGAGYGTNAYGNTMIGHYSGYDTTSGDYNTSLGWNAGKDITTGNYNVCLGYVAGKSASPSGSITTGTTRICLGDNQITNAYIKVAWTVTSDERDKADVTTFTGGLDWINAMRPVTYKWDERSCYVDKELHNEEGEIIQEVGTSADILAAVPDGTHKKDSLQIGLIAQEVLAIEQANGYGSNNDTSLLVDLTEDETSYGLSYEKVVPILVSAMKEQQTIIDDLKSRIETLED